MENKLPPKPPAPPLLALTLTPAQQKNLLGFLQRASLTGREAPAYMELFSIISAAQPPHPKSSDPNPQSSLQ